MVGFEMFATLGVNFSMTCTALDVIVLLLVLVLLYTIIFVIPAEYEDTPFHFRPSFPHCLKGRTILCPLRSDLKRFTVRLTLHLLAIKQLGYWSVAQIVITVTHKYWLPTPSTNGQYLVTELTLLALGVESLSIESLILILVSITFLRFRINTSTDIKCLAVKLALYFFGIGSLEDESLVPLLITVISAKCDVTVPEDIQVLTSKTVVFLYKIQGLTSGRSLVSYLLPFAFEHCFPTASDYLLQESTISFLTTYVLGLSSQRMGSSLIVRSISLFVRYYSTGIPTATLRLAIKVALHAVRWERLTGTSLVIIAGPVVAKRCLSESWESLVLMVTEELNS